MSLSNNNKFKGSTLPAFRG